MVWGLGLEMGFRVLEIRVLGLGFKVLEIRVLGFRILEWIRV